MVAAVILVTGLLGTVTLLDHAGQSTYSTRAREGATALEREIIEASRSIPYDQLTPAGIVPALQAQGQLSDASVSDPGWTIRRRGFTYTVSVGECAVDDPRDLYGNHDPGVFCANGAGTTSQTQCRNLLGITGIVSSSLANATASATLGDCGIDVNADGQVDGLVDLAGSLCIGTCATGGLDSNPADYKRVVVLISWDKGTGSRWELQSTTIANPGLSAAPAVNSLDTSASLPVTSDTSLAFAAQTSIAPASFSWYVDGTLKGAAAGSSTSWNFTWNLGTVAGGSAPNPDEVLDGTYLVGARAFDTYGQPGAMRTKTIVINRSAPYPPQQVAAGRSGSNVNVEWAPNKERDVVGYRAYRSADGGTNWVLACALTTKTMCQDTSPPGSSALIYQVVAVDRDTSNNLREGTRSAGVNVPVSGANSPPNPPTNFAGAVSGGSTLLAWKAPLIPDPDLGDSIDHYNIYRDGTTFADRYDRTATGSILNYTDTHTNGVQHSYWITAVDTHLAESSMVGPVTK